MAEHNDTATEKPTEKKVSDSHKKGQFAQAQEIQMVAGLIAAYFILLFTLGDQARFLTEFVASVLGNLEKYEIISQAIPQWTTMGFLMLFGLLIPMMMATTVASVRDEPNSGRSQPGTPA